MVIIWIVSKWSDTAGPEAEVTKANLELPEDADRGSISTIPIIPGMKAVDVYLNLEKMGFATNKEWEGTNARMLCQRADADGTYFVAINCLGASDVRFVEAIIENASGRHQEAPDFLSYIATLPYKNAQPEVARGWVKRHFGVTAQTVISGVHFYLAPIQDTRSHSLIISADSNPSGVITPPTQNETPDPALKNLPAITGWTLAEVISRHGEPKTQDRDSGWASWPAFRARFESGAVVEVAAN